MKCIAYTKSYLDLVNFFLGCPLWTWRARVPNPNDCSDSVMYLWVGETQSITSNFASPPVDRKEDVKDIIKFNSI